MNGSADELNERRSKALAMGNAERLAQRRAEGRLTARDRIGALLDPDSFHERGLLTHSDIYGMEAKTPADGKICGYGRIEGRTVAVMADDFSVLAGSGGRVGGRKYARLFAHAVENGYPIVNLGEGGGARIPDIMGSDGLSSMTIGKDVGRRMRRVPMAAAIMGECFGAPAWFAALSDFVVQVKGSCMAVSGPRVLEVATGETATNDELGGWKLHAETTGLVDRVAEDDGECLAIVRRFLSYLPSHAGALPPVSADDPHAAARQGAIASILPAKDNRGYDMHRIIETLCDADTVFPLKPDFDRSVITCLARIGGRVVGVIANNPMHLAGAMGPDGCNKCASFICLCDSFHIPLIFLHDTPGFFVGKAAERKGMPGRIINFIEALSLSTVPKISLVIRRSYGMAYGNMCGGGMGADIELAWPTADISFAAPEVAANIVYQRKIAESADPEEARRLAVAEMRAASAPWRAAGLGHLDDVVAPHESRSAILHALTLASSGAKKGISDRLLAGWPTSFA